MKERIVFCLMRISFGVVFLVFGIGKFQNDYWARTIATMEFFEKLPWDVNLSVLLIGLIEVIVGVCLIVGFLTQLFSAITAFLLIGILVLLRFSEVRDIGLLGVALYMTFSKNSSFGVDSLLARRRR